MEEGDDADALTERERERERQRETERDREGGAFLQLEVRVILQELLGDWAGVSVADRRDSWL